MKSSYRLSYANLITAVMIWSYLVMPHLLPWPVLSGALLVYLTRIFVGHFFSDSYFEFEFNRDFFLAFGGFALGSLFFHNSHLLLPMASDEPHHAERTLFLLKSFFDWLSPWLPFETFESLRFSFWNMLDARAMSPVDLWPFLFWFFVLLLGAVVGLWRWLLGQCSFKQALVVDAGMILLIASIGWAVRGWPDGHPPLRTLLPFFSSGFLGLNAFAFRIAGVIGCSFIFALWFQALKKEFPLKTALALGALIFLSPLIMFNSILVEPSIYGFMGWFSVFILLIRAMEKDQVEDLKMAALLVPIVVLFRQPSILLFLPIGLVYLLRFRGRLAFPWIWAPLVALVCAPYFWSLKQVGNSAGGGGFELSRIISIFTDGKPLMGLFNSQGYLWSLALVVLIILGLWNFRKTYWFMLSWSVLFVIYHLITVDTTWGLPRYQMEFFLGPAAALAYWIFKIHQPSFQVAGVLAVLLGVQSFNHINSIPIDTFPKDYQALRVSNTTFLPEDQVLRYLKRQKADFHFVFIGGSIPTFESLLWFQGYNLWSSRFWLNQAYEFQIVVERAESWDQLKDYFSARGIKYLILTEAMERDFHARSERTQKWITNIKQGETGSLKIKLDRSFSNHFGGMLDVYRIE